MAPPAAPALLASSLLADVLLVVPAANPANAATFFSCSDCDPIRDSELIVSGRVESWRRADGSTEPGSYIPVVVELRVDTVYKGRSEPLLTMVDRASLQVDRVRGDRWIGASGACGALDADPAGRYFVIGLSPDDRGELRMNRIQTLFVGDEPNGPRYDRAVNRLEGRLGPPGPPSTGSGLAPRSESIATPVVLLFGAIMLALAAAHFGARRPKA
ncbi:MAG: hypothetical protein ACR2HN_07540 [Tepidiformaceae bacterium]